MSGYSPASNLTSNLPQSTVVYHDRKFVQNLKQNTPWLKVCELRELPLNSGNQLRLYMYNVLGANTNQTSEGTVGSGISVSVNTTTPTIGQYSDYCNVSDIALEMAIDNTLENIQRELAYRLALSLSTITKTTADAANTTDSKVGALSKVGAATITRSDITAMTQSLAGQNVKPFMDGKMVGIVHPFNVGDVINDNTNNSLVDILKRDAGGQKRLEELPTGEDDAQIMDWGGAYWYQSTLVTQTANYSGTAKTANRTYMFGQDAIFRVSLGSKEGAKVGDGDWRNLKLFMMRAETPTVADPSRVIGGWTSYNVKYTTSLPPDTTMRMRYIDAVSNIS